MVKYTRVLLIDPNYFGSYYGSSGIPTGLGYISEALNRTGIENTIVDMDFGDGPSGLRQRVQEFEPNLIGLGMMSFRYKDTYGVIEQLKDWFPEIPIVVGGPHVSIMRSKVLEECQSIDFGITLEGEESIVELCQGGVPLTEIRGLLHRGAAGEILYCGDRPFIEDLDGNGFPTYSRFELNRYGAYRPIVTSRGCPYQCIYCSVKRVVGTRFRDRSARSVAEELQYWHKRGVRTFYVVDDNFTLRRDRVSQICDEMERRDVLGSNIILGNGVRADRVDRALLARMREVGFNYIAFGVEGGNDKVLKRLKKGVSIDVIERSISDACDLGYQVVLFFLIGSPGETEKDIQDSVRLATKYPVYEVTFNNLIPFPGTELYDWVANNQFFINGADYLQDVTQRANIPTFETPELPYQKRKELYEWATRTVASHTLTAKRSVHGPEMVRNLESMGLPSFMARGFANMYWSRAFHQCFRQTGLLRKMSRAVNR